MLAPPVMKGGSGYTCAQFLCGNYRMHQSDCSCSILCLLYECVRMYVHVFMFVCVSVCTYLHSCEIQWNKGKNVTMKTMKKTQKHKCMR